MLSQHLRRAPPIYIGREDLDPQDPNSFREMEFMLHPENFREVINVEWTGVTVPGLSHQVLQYSHTDNLAFERFSLFMARLAENSSDRVARKALSPRGYLDDRLINARNFLQQFCYPVGLVDSQQGGAISDAPPRALLVIPTVSQNISAPGASRSVKGLEKPIISMSVVFKRMETTYLQYTPEGMMNFIRFDIDMVEIRDVMMTSQMAAREGSVRAPTPKSLLNRSVVSSPSISMPSPARVQDR